MVETEAEFELVLKLLYSGIHLPWNLPMVGENQWTRLSPKWTNTEKVYTEDLWVEPQLMVAMAEFIMFPYIGFPHCPSPASFSCYLIFLPKRTIFMQTIVSDSAFWKPKLNIYLR